VKTSALPCLLAVALTVLSGCGKPPPAKRRDVPVPVVAETARLMPVRDVVDTVGRVEAQSVSNVGSQLPGRLVEMTREVGDLVPGACGDPAKDRGALLARLDTATLEAQAERLAAELKLAATRLPTLKTEWTRQETLLKEGSSTEQRRDQAKMAYDVAAAQVATARAARKEIQVQIELSSIYAPMDAVVVKKVANVGDVVSPMFSPQLYQLQCIRDLKINVIVRERDVPHVKAQSHAAVTFDALPGRAFTGRIHTVIPSGDPIAHSFIAEVRFRNRILKDKKDPKSEAVPLPAQLPAGLTPDDLLIKPGMFARIKILKYEKDKAVVLPARCVIEEGDKAFVYRIDPDGRARKTPVTAGVTMGDHVELVDGLKPGDTVVGRGIENVTQAQPVRVIADAAPPGR